MPNLQNIQVAILTENGFEQSELLSPKKTMEESGVTVHVISPRENEVKGWDQGNWGETVKVDKKLSEANPGEYDGLMLPGGVMNPDKLRMNADAVRFVRQFFDSGKPVAAICHGPWMLVEAGVLEGREATSYPSIRTDMINAGARWVDQEVVVDQGLITSRSPADLPAFNAKLLEELQEGVHEAR